MFDLIISTLTQGFIYALLSYGIYITYKILDFPDLTVDGSFPLGAAIAAVLLVKEVNPFVALLAAIAVGAVAGLVTGVIHVKFGVRDLLAGIITLGEKGSYCFDGADHYAPPVPASVKDTIGAGDSHMGAVISARRLGLSFADAIWAANHISSAVVSNAGGLLEAEDFAKALASMPLELQKKLK